LLLHEWGRWRGRRKLLAFPEDPPSHVDHHCRCKWLLLASAEKRELVDAAAAAENYEGAEHIQNEVDLYQGELNKLVSEYEILPSELADEARNEEVAAGQAQDLSADSSEATAAAVDTDTGTPEAAADSGIGTEGAA